MTDWQKISEYVLIGVFCLIAGIVFGAILITPTPIEKNQILDTPINLNGPVICDDANVFAIRVNASCILGCDFGGEPKKDTNQYYSCIQDCHDYFYGVSE